MTTTTTTRSSLTPPDMPRSPLYDPVSGRFNARRLQRKVFVRGWTSEEFAAECPCSRTSVYKALAGQPVRNRTARAIFETLHKREPRAWSLE